MKTEVPSHYIKFVIENDSSELEANLPPPLNLEILESIAWELNFGLLSSPSTIDTGIELKVITPYYVAT